MIISVVSSRFTNTSWGLPRTGSPWAPWLFGHDGMDRRIEGFGGKKNSPTQQQESRTYMGSFHSHGGIQKWFRMEHPI